MPTYAFTRTREQLRDMVLGKLGFAVGETPDAADSAKVYEGIDLRLKELHKLGVLWWQVSGVVTDVMLTSGVATATAPTDMLFPVTAALRISGVDYPIEIAGHRRYHEAQDKTDQGEPRLVYHYGTTLRFWPVPDAGYTVKLTYEAIAADTTSGTAPDIPVAMMRALAVIVASDLADDYGLPEGTIQRLMAQAEAAMRTIRALNAERVDTGVIQAEYF